MPHSYLRLGERGPDLSAGFAKIRAQAQLPTEYPAEAVAELREPARLRPERVDRRDLPLRTLDPPGSMDLDQAFYLERRTGGYTVNYAIADVAAFVPPGGALDAETHRRALTVYCPDERVPLHPVALSEGAGSLLPDQERPAVLWRIDVDDDGAIADVDVRRAIVRSRSRHDYAEAHAALTGEAGRPVSGCDEQWLALRDIGTARIDQERARGGVSLALPEQVISREGDGDGAGWRIDFRAVTPAEDYNAQLSLLTGMAAARIMLDGGIGVLRTMPPAGDEQLTKLRLRAAGLGIAWAEGEAYGDVLARVDSTTPAGAAFLNAAASLFRGAAWTAFEGAAPPDPAHAAIAAPYAHVTAPLRRLVDRYGTEICLALTSGQAVPEWVHAALATIGATMADGARRDGVVDRACTELVEAAVLQGSLGRDFDAIAITANSIQIPDPAVVAPCEPATGTALAAGTALRARLIAADLDPVKVAFRQVVGER